MEEYELSYSAGNVKQAMSGVKSADLWKVPFDRLVVRDGFNIRDEGPDLDAHIRWIADSIKANGYENEHPFGVFIDGDQIVVHAGHCRYRAVALAISEGCEIIEVPCVTVPKGTSAEDMTVALYTSNGGKRLTPIELGRVCKRLIRFNWDEAKVAARLGISAGYVTQLMTLMEAPAELRQMVSDGKLAAGEAISLISKHGPLALTKALSALGNAESEAVEKGQDPAAAKATKKHIEADSVTKLERAAKNKGLELYNIVKDMLEDKAFLSLNEKIRARVRDTFDAIDRKLS